MTRFLLAISLFVGIVFFTFLNLQPSYQQSGAPPYAITETTPSDKEVDDFLQDWLRPPGPPKVALQVGHWKNEEVPDELQRLRGNTGATGGGKMEWEVNYRIAELTKELLEKHGVTVELLPATVPPRYWADVFIAIHADGNDNTSKTGYKAVGPWRDLTGNADELVQMTQDAYQKATGMQYDDNITRNMRGYYAFGWWRYEHAVHPMTTAIIFETGYLTSPLDRKIIVQQPELSAEGLSNGIIAYLEKQKFLET